MGYTVFAKLKTPEVTKAFFDFLNDNSFGINSVIKSKFETYPVDDDRHSSLRISDELSYIGDLKKVDNLIGFDYNASGVEREFCFEVVRMMQSEEGSGDYYYYDGSPFKVGPPTLREKIRDLATKYNEQDKLNGRSKTVDDHINSLTMMSCFSYDSSITPDQLLDIIDNEVKRLRELWKKNKNNYIKVN